MLMVLSKTLPRSLALNLMLFKRWRSGWLECDKDSIFMILLFFLEFLTFLRTIHELLWTSKISSLFPDYFHDLSTPHRIILFKHCVSHVSCFIFLFSFQSVAVMVVSAFHLHATLFMPVRSLCHFAVTLHQRFPIDCYASFRNSLLFLLIIMIN